MSINYVRRAAVVCVALLAAAVTSGCPGPAGPAGPPGPAGPGGPPFVWVCTPLSFANVGSNARTDLYVFNGGAANANVSVNILDATGNNLAGHNVPGTNPAQTYPGQTGSNTVAVAPAHTLNVNWVSPVTGPPQGGFDGVTDVSVSVRVTSDQPVVVSTNLWWGGPSPVPCSLVPK